MKLTIELTKFEPHLESAKIPDGNKGQLNVHVIKWYDVGFTITHASGLELYAPATVMYKPNLTESDIVGLAAKDVLYGQIAEAYRLLNSEEEDGN